MDELFSKAINLFILLVVLVYFLRKPIRDYVKDRHQNLKTELKDVKEKLKRAEKEKLEVSEKVSKVETRIKEIHELMRQEAEIWRHKVLGEARKMARTIIDDAQDAAESHHEGLKTEIKTELGLEILAKAESILKEGISEKNKKQIQENFFKNVEKTQ